MKDQKKNQKSKSLDLGGATTLPGEPSSEWPNESEWPTDPSWPNPNPERPTTLNPGDQFLLDIRHAKNERQDDWSPYAEPQAPKNAPNILYIVLDDTGFGAWSMFGGKIQMPNLERIANQGLIYTNFHTTALCSPTRSSLLNGRNANTNGMACIEEATSAFPGSNGRIPKENAFIAETLGERGYNTYCIGKWHLCPEEESNMASTKRNWPLGRGFERYYGFLGGETDQWYPDLVYDNHIVEPPYAPDMSNPEKGYHLSKDLVDKAISFIQDGKAIAPTKPWMMYFCPGANHAPHQIWPALIGNPGYPAGAVDSSGVSLNERCRYNDPNTFSGSGGYGKYDPSQSVFASGYEQYRNDIFAVMKTPLGQPVGTYVQSNTGYFEGYFPNGVAESFPDDAVTGLGIFPPETLLPSVNPHGEGVPPINEEDIQSDEATLYGQDFKVKDGGQKGKIWPSTEYVIPWDYDSDDQINSRQELFIRMAETYAAFSTYTDRQIGRLLDFLEETGQMEHTIIVAVADNGASGEGGPNGSINENLFFNDIPDDLDTNMNALEDIGTDRTYNHYPSGWAWAFDTPFKYWKRWSNYEGGDATPFMICGPGINRNPKYAGDSGFRKQYVHACDLVPTLYEHLGLQGDDLTTVKGYEQNPFDGTSFRYTFDSKYGQPEYQFPHKLQPSDKPTDPDTNETLPVKETQFYAMLGTRGIWHKGWHACTFHPPTPSDWGNFEADDWELYCMDSDTLSGDIFGDSGLDCTSGKKLSIDPTQSNNLLETETEQAVKDDLNVILAYLQSKWDEEANKYFGKPLDDRSTAVVLGEQRPQLSDPPFEEGDTNKEHTFTYGPYYPGGSEIPEAVAPNIRTRSYSVSAIVNFTNVSDINDVKGVLFSHGGRFGGHSFYIHEGRLCYVYNWLGQEAQKISCEVPLDNISGSHVQLTAKFDKREPQPSDLPTEYGGSVVGEVELLVQLMHCDSSGNLVPNASPPIIPSPSLSLYNKATKQWAAWDTASPNWTSGEDFMTQPAKFALCGEGMNIGKDAGQPVSPDYAAEIPYEFEGSAVLKRVTVTIKNDAAPTDPAKEMRGMLLRD